MPKNRKSQGTKEAAHGSCRHLLENCLVRCTNLQQPHRKGRPLRDWDPGPKRTAAGTPRESLTESQEVKQSTGSQPRLLADTAWASVWPSGIWEASQHVPAGSLDGAAPGSLPGTRTSLIGANDVCWLCSWGDWHWDHPRPPLQSLSAALGLKHVGMVADLELETGME